MKMSLRASFSRVYSAYSCFINNFNFMDGFEQFEGLDIFKQVHFSNPRSACASTVMVMCAGLIFKAICEIGRGPQNVFDTNTAGEREK